MKNNIYLALYPSSVSVQSNETLAGPSIVTDRVPNGQQNI